MPKRRVSVLILYRHPLLGQGIERLLLREHDLDVTSRQVGAEEAPAVAADVRPDAIVMEMDGPGQPVDALVDALPPVPVVFISLGDNNMSVYRGRQSVIPEGTLLDLARDLVSGAASAAAQQEASAAARAARPKAG